MRMSSMLCDFKAAGEGTDAVAGARGAGEGAKGLGETAGVEGFVVIWETASDFKLSEVFLDLLKCLLERRGARRFSQSSGPVSVYPHS
jgi:hypothetical protein